MVSRDLSATTDGLLNKDQFLLILWECVWINCRSWCFNELGSSLYSLLQSSTEASSFICKFLFCCLNVWTLTILKIIPTRWVVDMINKLHVLVSRFQMGAWTKAEDLESAQSHQIGIYPAPRAEKRSPMLTAGTQAPSDQVYIHRLKICNCIVGHSNGPLLCLSH